MGDLRRSFSVSVFPHPNPFTVSTSSFIHLQYSWERHAHHPWALQATHTPNTKKSCHLLFLLFHCGRRPGPDAKRAAGHRVKQVCCDVAAGSLRVAGKASEIPPIGRSLERVPGGQIAKHSSQWRVSGQRGGPLTDGCQSKMKSTKRLPIFKWVFSFRPWKHSWKSNILPSHHWAPQKFKKPNPKTASNERPTHTICGDFLLVTRTVTSFAVSTSSFTHLHPLRGTRSPPTASVPLSCWQIQDPDRSLTFIRRRASNLDR